MLKFNLENLYARPCLRELKKYSDVWQFKAFKPGFCSDILRICERSHDWVESAAYDTKNKRAVSVNARISQHLPLKILGAKFEEAILKSFSHRILPFIRGIWSVRVNRFNDFHVVRYREGGLFRLHGDAKTSLHLRERQFSVLCNLNSDFTGGVVNFPRQNVRYEPDTGRVVLFPSGMTHLHESTEVTEGVKYVIVGWVVQE